MIFCGLKQPTPESRAYEFLSAHFESTTFNDAEDEPTDEELDAMPRYTDEQVAVVASLFKTEDTLRARIRELERHINEIDEAARRVIAALEKVEAK